MTTYYVGAGGNDGNAGTSWALRKLTLTGAEALSLTGDDLVWVGPGVYRETHTPTHAGTSGHPITFQGDILGTHTDGVGGIVRITGSDDDQSATRTDAIAGYGVAYRVWRGFMMDTTTGLVANIAGADGSGLEDCYLAHGASGVIFDTGIGAYLKRCMIVGMLYNGVQFYAGSPVTNRSVLLENLVILMGSANTTCCIKNEYIGGVTLRNSLLFGGYFGVGVFGAPGAGQGTVVNNCVVESNQYGFYATGTADITEDYNALYNNGTARTNTNTGAHSVAYPALYQPPKLVSGSVYDWMFPMLSQWSQVGALAGTGVASDDLHGITRAHPSSWGAVQYEATRRPTDSGEPRGRRGQ